jgi:hypothetical protein
MGCGNSKEDATPPVAAAKVRSIFPNVDWLFIGFWLLVALRCVAWSAAPYNSSFSFERPLLRSGSRLHTCIRILVQSVRFLSHSCPYFVHSLVPFCFFHQLYPHYESYLSYCGTIACYYCGCQSVGPQGRSQNSGLACQSQQAQGCPQGW